jgi:hypothetical protein
MSSGFDFRFERTKCQFIEHQAPIQDVMQDVDFLNTKRPLVGKVIPCAIPRSIPEFAGQSTLPAVNVYDDVHTLPLLLQNIWAVSAVVEATPHRHVWPATCQPRLTLQHSGSYGSGLRVFHLEVGASSWEELDDAEGVHNISFTQSDVSFTVPHFSFFCVGAAIQSFVDSVRGTEKVVVYAGTLRAETCEVDFYLVPDRVDARSKFVSTMKEGDKAYSESPAVCIGYKDTVKIEIRSNDTVEGIVQVQWLGQEIITVTMSVHVGTTGLATAKAKASYIAVSNGLHSLAGPLVSFSDVNQAFGQQLPRPLSQVCGVAPSPGALSFQIPFMANLWQTDGPWWKVLGSDVQVCEIDCSGGKCLSEQHQQSVEDMWALAARVPGNSFLREEFRVSKLLLVQSQLRNAALCSKVQDLNQQLQNPRFNLESRNDQVYHIFVRICFLCWRV